MSHQYMDIGMERWILATARRNLWRVPKWYDYDDLVQDGYMCYGKCRDTYQRLQRKRSFRLTPDDRKRFMALVKTTYLRHITDLANQRTAQPEKPISQICSPEETIEAWLDRMAAMVTSDAQQIATGTLNDLHNFLKDVRVEWRETRNVIKAIIECRPYYVRVPAGKFRKWVSPNEHLCQLVNLDPDEVDLVDRLRQYFNVQNPGASKG